MVRLRWTKKGTGYASKCGRFVIRHTGTAGRSTRVFTATDTNTGKDFYVGGLMAVKRAAEGRVER